MKDKIKNIFSNLISIEKSPKKLTLSFVLGVFIAFTPTIPFQTPLIFLLSRLFRLSTKVTFITVYLVNNPITMVPLYIMDYMFGSWLLNAVFKIDPEKYNPIWIDKFSSYIAKYIDLQKHLGGSVLCFWCFVVGGVVLPLLVSVLSYFIMYPIFKKLVSSDENYSTK